MPRIIAELMYQARRDLGVKYKGDFSKIIEAPKRPNADVVKLLSKFKEWLDSQ